MVRLISWIIAGIIGGLLCRQLFKYGGYGLIGDLVLGVIGALLLIWLLKLVGWGGATTGLIGSIVACIGGLLFAWWVRCVS